MDRPRPLLLRADNFTPPTRTPWGGRRILSVYKSGLPLDPERAAYPVVGESWEVSVEPDFPSRIEGTDRTLAQAVAADPRAWVGEEAAGKAGGCPLLVKLLDAADPLSLQIHPSDDYPGLDPGQSGKPESWYVLHAEPGAGLYLGLRSGVDEPTLKRALEAGEDLTGHLFFTPVRPGDFFVIGAGTAHAIGAGVTLVEPQRVLPGRRGVTYRYWDWNRRYDGGGQPDPAGRPRPLHLADALAVTDWEGPREGALLGTIRYRAGEPPQDGDARIEPLCGEGAPVGGSPLEVARLVGSGVVRVPARDRLRGLTVVGGRVRLVGDGFDVVVERGRSAALPAALESLRAELSGAHAVLASSAA